MDALLALRQGVQPRGTDAERILGELTDLLHRHREALTHGHENTLRVIDQQFEHKLREKDRAMAALFEHSKQHGC